MAAYFSAVVKSPVTGAILIMEMTGSFQHLLSLMLVSMTAFLVAEYMGSEPVYDMLLNRSLALMDKARKHIKESRVTG
jgi:H+/Cl- antiporter ClcA